MIIDCINQFKPLIIEGLNLRKLAMYNLHDKRRILYMKYREIINISRNGHLSSVSEKKLPMKIKLPLFANIRKLKEAMVDWEVSFTELLNRYANKDKNGNPSVINEKYDIPEDKIKDYNKEFDDILSCDSGLLEKDLQYIPIEYFEDYDETKFDVLTINEMEALLFMIK